MAKIDRKFRSIPLKFEIKKEFELKEDDIRYSLAKLYIMHDGRNYNGSSFSKEVIEACKHTAYNMPVIGYIEDDDFSDHRYEIEKNADGEYEYNCKQQAIGVIPESAELYMEEILGDDGIKRNYLVADNVIIWRKWNDVNKIFDDESQKWHSCELSDNSTGYYDDKNNEYVFENFEFFGFTVLGGKYKPAMKESNIEIKHFAEVNTDVVKENLEKFMKHFSKEVEELTVKDNKNFENETSEVEAIEEIDANGNEVLDNQDREEQQVEENSSEEVINEEAEETAENLDESQEEVQNGEVEQEFSDKREFKFTLSHEDVRCKIYDKLWEVDKADGDWYYIYKVYNDYFIYVNENQDIFFKQGYSTENDEFNFVGEREKLYCILVNEETYNNMNAKTYSQLEVELANMKANFEILKTENESLKEFKLNIEKEKAKAEIDEVINKFTNLTELEYAELKDDAYNLKITKNELEEKLYALVGRKNFSLNQNDIVTQNNQRAFALNLSGDKPECPYQGLEGLFVKNN